VKSRNYLITRCLAEFATQLRINPYLQNKDNLDKYLLIYRKKLDYLYFGVIGIELHKLVDRFNNPKLTIEIEALYDHLINSDL